jgi:alpha-beta hydrolase superfamily lysophospholipase
MRSAAHTNSAEPTHRALRIESRGGVKLHASLFPAQRPQAGLLLVHGLQSHAGWFEAAGTAAGLAAAGIACLAYDRRGSGRSDGVRGHAESAEDFVADLAAGERALRSELPRGASVHVLANCFGARAVISHAAEHPEAFRSLVLTAPATHMSRRASYGLARKLEILLSPARRLVPTPLHDEDFVRAGPWLDWIRCDERSLRTVTARFLRSANRLTRRMQAAIPHLRAPMLVVLSTRDVLVDNDAIRERFFEPYAGPKELVEYDTDHYVDFTDARPDLECRIAAWVLRHS